MEKVDAITKEFNISRATYYKICKRLGRRATKEDVQEHIRTRRNGRPPKENW